MKFLGSFILVLFGLGFGYFALNFIAQCKSVPFDLLGILSTFYGIIGFILTSIGFFLLAFIGIRKKIRFRNTGIH